MLDGEVLFKTSALSRLPQLLVKELFSMARHGVFRDLTVYEPVSVSKKFSNLSLAVSRSSVKTCA
jgi:hypothetical protein